MTKLNKRQGADGNCALDIADENGVVRPEFIRIPRIGEKCSVTGLCRSKLNQLILPCEENGHRPPVRSVSLRKRGAVRGVRLIPTDELVAYLRQELENQNKGEN